MNFDIEWPASASAVERAVEKRRNRWPVIAGFLVTLTIVAGSALQVYTCTTVIHYESAHAGTIRDQAIALDAPADVHNVDALDRQMRRLQQLAADDTEQQADLDRNIRSQFGACLALLLLASATLCLNCGVVYVQTRSKLGAESKKDARQEAEQNELVSRANFDIRSALMAILGYCDLPREDGAPEQDRFALIRQQTCEIIAAVDGFVKTSAASSARAWPLTLAASPPEPHLSARVLLAEDDPHLQDVIKFYLQSSGAEVTIVADGQLAYDQAMVSMRHGKPFDLILMDVQMPRLDGCQATVQLREAGYAHPIVAITADATDRERSRCTAAGCNGFLTKPVDREEFSQATRRFVRQGLPAQAPVVHRELPAQAPAGEVPDPIFDAQVDVLRESFRGVIRSRIAEITIAVSAKDLARVAQLAHRLKGTSGCYGFSALSDSSDALQSAAALPEGEETIRQCLQTLSEQAEKLIRTEAA